jgi:hypothetical protein
VSGRFNGSGEEEAGDRRRYAVW